VPPDEFLGTNQTAREVERLLTNIRERERVEDALREQLTERKQAEEALRDAQTELAHVTRVMTMGELTASIAHEINQPLAAVVTNANAGLRWLAGPIPNLSEAREALARITRDGKRASDVIGRIRALVKKSSTEKAGLDLNEAIQEVVVLVQSEIQKSEVTLQMELAIDLPQILGNRVQLQQVILNLVMNGIEAMSAVTDRSRDLLIRSCKYESDKVLVAAQDSGIGLISRISKDLRCFLHHQVAGNGHGTGDQPLDCRESRRTIVGRAEYRPWRNVSIYSFEESPSLA
jgi:C4-dicarboxylate-specific signal transduction histidine kinase